MRRFILRLTEGTRREVYSLLGDKSGLSEQLRLALRRALNEPVVYYTDDNLEGKRARVTIGGVSFAEDE